MYMIVDWFRDGPISRNHDYAMGTLHLFIIYGTVSDSLVRKMFTRDLQNKIIAYRSSFE